MNDWAWPLAAVSGAVAGALLGAGQHRLLRGQPGPAPQALLLRAAGAAAALAGAWAVSFRPGQGWGAALLAAGFATVFVAAASADIAYRRIPNRLTYPAALAALALCWAWPDRSALAILAGAAIVTVVAVLLYVGGLVAGRGAVAFGMGDVKLLAVGGLVLGWPLALPALFLGMLAGAAWSLVLLARQGGRTRFAYGPFLALGILVPLLWPATFS